MSKSRQATAWIALILLLFVGCAPASDTDRLEGASLLIARGKYGEAAQTLEDVITSDPMRSEAYQALYDVYIAADQPEEALGVLERASALWPDAFSYADRIADHLAACGDEARAGQVLSDFLAKYPDDRPAYDAALAFCIANGDWEGVRALTSARFERDPHDRATLITWAQAALALGDCQSVRNRLDAFVESHPDDPFALQWLACACLKAGDADVAVALFEGEGVRASIDAATGAAVYAGDRDEAGLPHGQGVIYYGDSKEVSLLYLGSFEHGLRSGSGTVFTKSGLRLSGHWDSDLPNGDCIKRWLGTIATLRIRYIGGRPSGNASYVHVDGAQYALDASAGVPIEIERDAEGNVVVARTRTGDEETTLFFTPCDVETGSFRDFFQPLAD